MFFNVLLILLIILASFIVIFLLLVTPDFYYSQRKKNKSLCEEKECDLNEIGIAKYNAEITKSYYLEKIKTILTFFTVAITAIGIILAYGNYITQEKIAKNERVLKEFLSLSERITNDDSLPSVNAIVSLPKFADTEYLQDVVDIITYNLLYTSIKNGNYTSKSIWSYNYRTIYNSKSGIINISELACVDALSKISTKIQLKNKSLNDKEKLKINLNNKVLRGVFLVNAELNGATFQDAHLQGANLNGADLNDCDLSYSHLEAANLRNVKSKNAVYKGAYLNRVNFDYAILKNANLANAKLDYTSFKGACLIEAILPKNITNDNVFDYCIIDKQNFDNQIILKDKYYFVTNLTKEQKLELKENTPKTWDWVNYQTYYFDYTSQNPSNPIGILFPKV